MFEAAELGRKISKADYKARERELHTELLEVQRRLRDSDTTVLLIVSGVEGAGKGAVVSQLNTWLDARGIRTQAFWDESDEERERPRFWRFWRDLPPRGTIGIMFGSWYTQPIVDRAFGRMGAGPYERELARIGQFERMLTDDGALIVKFWFHLSKKTQRARLEAEAKDKGVASPYTRKYAKRYDAFLGVSERALRDTDTARCPWYVIESEDARYRDLTVGETLLRVLRERLAQEAEPSRPTAHPGPVAPASASARRTVLDRVPLESRLSSKSYDRKLRRYQRELSSLAWKAHKAGTNVVAVFEGWDAAGKGGAIRRVTAAVDARLYRVISVAAPTDEERARHYLWRFWRHVPRAGYFTMYDRSWYGRVLVERVEGFARDDEWQRAYQEINEFEEQLVNHGMVLLKFWVHISADEQLRRFEERKITPWKMHKITDEDWRNRERWGEYEAAVNDMVSRTSTGFAPWTLVPGNDKRFSRVEVIKTFCKRLRAALG